MIREILDHHGMAMVCQVEELATTLEQLHKPPKLVITDSQAFEAVSQIDSLNKFLHFDGTV